MRILKNMLPTVGSARHNSAILSVALYSEYLYEAKSISDALNAIDEPVSDNGFAQHVLRGVGAKFDMLVTFIET